MSEEKILDGETLQVLLDKDACFEGELRFKGTARLFGEFKGLIQGEGTLIIEKEARVQAELEVGELFLLGELEGSVVAKRAVQMKIPASFKGQIKSPSLSIEPGVSFEGSSQR